VREMHLTVDGQAHPVTETFAVLNPADEEVLAHAPVCDEATMQLALNAAERAQPDWALDDERRKKALLQCADIIDAHVEELAQVLTLEQGKPLEDARGEVKGTANVVRYAVSIDAQDEVLQDDAVGYAVLTRRPLGVVVAITPWNYPLILAAYKFAPALRAGNSVVVKPSPYTPLSSLYLGELLQEALPSGVFSVLSGGDDLGRLLTESPIPRKVSFTGSVPTGRKVAASAAQDFKRVTLELGGNDPAIVLADADLDVLADRLFWGVFSNSGQVCAVAKRIYVHRSLYAAVVDLLADRARSTPMGNGLSAGIKLGPLNNAQQLRIVEELVTDAVDQGAEVVVGGERASGPGYFYQPTVLTNVDDGVRVVDEEQFGPVIPVMVFDDVEDAIKRANRSSFGLGASVWSRDEQAARRVASQLQSGNVWVNTHSHYDPHLPFAGWKSSGLGVENGRLGYDAFTEVQVMYQAR
jgi:acyl-CoA reductase-like NAD-dependent aldehyde dehydrogenase